MVIVCFVFADLTDSSSFDKTKYWVDQLKAAEPVSAMLHIWIGHFHMASFTDSNCSKMTPSYQLTFPFTPSSLLTPCPEFSFVKYQNNTLGKCSTQQLLFKWSAHIKISSTFSEVTRIALYSIINNTTGKYCLKSLNNQSSGF